MDHKISIITITYNSEKTLEETILSVINQGYSNLEYIIIDGGSKDGTLDIINKYKDHISIVVSEPDEGISDAFNKGIGRASGEIIGIINSDDILLPGALETVSFNFEEGVDVYRGKTIIWDDQTDERLVQTPSMFFPVNRPFHQVIVCHQSTFVTKEAYLKYGCFDKRFRYNMDVDLLTRFSVKGAKMKFIDSELAVSRFGGVTDSFFMNMFNEVSLVETKNGGSWLSAKVKQMHYVVYQTIKLVLFKIFSPKIVRRFKYKRKK